jgi:hypothetical protein
MSGPKDKDPTQAPEAPSPPSPGSEKRSGRAGFDERGNSVWEWQLETGVYSRDVSTQKLKKLELGELSIAETAVNKRPEGWGGIEQSKPLPRGGFNPYDNSSKPAEGGFNPYDNARSAGPKLQPKGPAAAEPPARRKPADMQKLNEWLKLKKRTQEAKDRDDDEK